LFRPAPWGDWGTSGLSRTTIDEESKVASIALVTSDVYSIPEVTGDTVLRFDAHDIDPHDIDAHVDAIERLLDDERERRRLAERAHDRAEGFTWEKSAAETVDVYGSVLASEGVS